MSSWNAGKQRVAGSNEVFATRRTARSAYPRTDGLIEMESVMPDHQHISATDQGAENRELAGALEKVEKAEVEIARGEADLREAVRELDEIEQHRDHDKPVAIRVNNNAVTMPGRYATGLEIKEVAIRDGVDIKIAFVLFVELPDGNERVVKDDQTVDLHHDKCFEAIDNDDHS
jgi:hypothetical protein